MLQSSIQICHSNKIRLPNVLMEKILPRALGTSYWTTLSYCFTAYLDWDKSSSVTHNLLKWCSEETTNPLNVTPGRVKPGRQVRRPDIRGREDVAERRHQAKINSYEVVYMEFRHQSRSFASNTGRVQIILVVWTVVFRDAAGLSYKSKR